MVDMTSRMVNRVAHGIAVIPFFEAVKRLFLFVFLVSPLIGWAQHPSYWVLNHEQGLPSLKVYDLMEDSLGVVWAGTSEGLVHYDGLWLQILRTETARTQDRSMLQMGPNGQVWCINFAGELFLASYESMEQHPIPEGLATSKVSSIERIGDGLFFMTPHSTEWQLPILLSPQKASLILVQGIVWLRRKKPPQRSVHPMAKPINTITSLERCWN
jgi:hypothetical protein